MVTMFRKRILLWLVVVVAALAVLAMYLLRAADSGTYYEYATYADVKNDRSVQAATVPEFVPPSAKEIVGQYNVEFNTQTLEFTFGPADRDSMTRTFQKAEAEEANAIEEALRKYRWRRDLPAGSGAAIFLRHGTNETEYLLIDLNRARAYYAVERSRK